MKNKKKYIESVTFLLFLIMLVFSPIIVAAEIEVNLEDMTPDTTGPILHDLSISGTEATPENPLKLIAEVRDDLSGVKSVKVNYRKPGGASYSISLYLNSTTKKYEGTIHIGTYDPEGDWVLKSISLEDKKENTTVIDDIKDVGNVNQIDFNLYTIKVSGVLEKPEIPTVEIPERNGPIINSVSVSSQQVSPGGVIKLMADITDDSGVRSATIYYKSPKGKSKSVSLSLNQSTGMYEGNFQIDKYDELGTWIFQSIKSYDIYSNFSERSDLSENNITVSETTPDFIGPVITKASYTLQKISKSSAVVKLFFGVSDELSGAKTFNAAYQRPNGKTEYISFNYNYSTGEYEGEFHLDKYDWQGVYRLKSISISDKKDNTRIYNSGSEYLVENLLISHFDINVQSGGITISPAVPGTITFTEGRIELEPGQTHQLQLMLNYTDHTSKDITSYLDGTIYTSSNPSAVKVDKNGLITVNSNSEPAVVTIEAKNGTLNTDVKIIIPGKATDLNHLKVSPVKVSLSPGQTKQLSVIASLLTGNEDVSLGSTGTKYSSSNPAVATVNENGLIIIADEAKEGEIVKINVNYKDLESETVITVMGPPTVESLVMTPSITEVFISKDRGATIQLNVAALMSDGTYSNATSGTAGTVYTTTDKSRSIVNEDGLITIPANITSGQVTITAINNNKVVKSILQISGVPSLETIKLTNAIPSTILQDQSYQISNLLANWSNGTQTSVTSDIMYESSRPDRITVTETGLIEPVAGAKGSSYIYVKYGGKTIRTTVSVEAGPTLSNIELVNVIPATLAHDRNYQISDVLAEWSDGTQTTPTTGITYESSNPERITVTETGLIEPVAGAKGSSYVYVKYGGKTIRTLVSLEAGPTLSSIGLANVIPATLAHGGSHQISDVLAKWSNGTQTTPTTGITYESSNPERITVTETGLIEPVVGAKGSSYIYVNYGGKMIRTLVSLEAGPTISSIELANVIPATLVHGGSHQISDVLVKWSNGTQTTPTTGITYESSNPERITVTETGLIEPVVGAKGSSYIYVNYGGKTIRTLVRLQAGNI